MFSDFTAMYKPIAHYPSGDSTLPFSQYITACKAVIEERRLDLHGTQEHIDKIVNANCPYELYPPHPEKSHRKLKTGVLLLHGLLDSPFTLRDIGTRLQQQGILCRSVLLPGHGTQPADLLHTSYTDWIETATYGIRSLEQDVDRIFIIGYSTGGALAIQQALKHSNIAGLVLIAPALKLKAYIHFLTHFYAAMRFGSHNQWLVKVKENDYVKYRSIGYNPVYQVEALTDLNSDLLRQKSVTCPILGFMSEQDETVSATAAIDFFAKTDLPESAFYLYTPNKTQYPDKRIVLKDTHYPELGITQFSHISLPYSADNSHYGIHGDFPKASHPHPHLHTYQGYSRAGERFYPFLRKIGLMKKIPRELTYNPDFEFMMKKISEFILVAA